VQALRSGARHCQRIPKAAVGRTSTATSRQFAGWGSVSFTPVVNTENADEFADPQAQFTGTVFK
jgi:hypothetical protein